MTKIFNGRFTATTDQPFVVFLIGMRINKWWRFDKWMPVAGAMTPMLTTYLHTLKKDFCTLSSIGISLVRSQFNTGAPSKSWNNLRAIHQTRISALGRNSIRLSARMEASASGTRLIWWSRINSKCFTATCQNSDSARQWNIRLPWDDARPHVCGFPLIPWNKKLKRFS